MFLIIDNHDSFVYTIADYIKSLHYNVSVYPCDQLSDAIINTLQPQGIIISPGPKHPKDAIESFHILTAYKGKIPILGICLGMQLIAYAAGASITRGKRPMHGKITPITHHGTGLFMHLPPTFHVTRYHSLIVQANTLPSTYRCDAFSTDGVLMGLSHKTLPLWGVQFHPEALLTEYGHELLQHFCILAHAYTSSHEGDYYV